jgi:hypothetical protein
MGAVLPKHRPDSLGKHEEKEHEHAPHRATHVLNDGSGSSKGRFGK